MLSQDLDRQFLQACETGNLDEVLKILYYHDNGPTKLLEVDPDSMDHMHYFHAACFHGHHDVVEQLFVFDVDVNLNSRYGTPISVASQGGHLETVKVLVKHGAKIHDPDLSETLSPIFQACKHGQLEIFNYLISKEPEVISLLGSHLLVQACCDGFLAIVIVLVSSNVDVNGSTISISPSSGCISFDSLLQTPLHAALSQGHVEVTEYLLQEGAEVTLDLVQNFHEVLGEVVISNFKEHSGRYNNAKKKNLKEADFRATNFHAIHESWFTRFSQQLVSVDLSNNHIQSVPRVIMNLPSLKDLDLSSNGLFDLPEVDDVVNSRLEEIRVSNNNLSRIPLSFFQIETLRHLNLAKNAICSLLSTEESGYYQLDDDDLDDAPVWHCSSLKSLDLAKNELTSIPLSIYAANNLEKLQLCNNKLTSFPRGWKCPLRILNLGNNQLEDFEESVFTSWSQTLEDLNLSFNKLTTISWDICQLQALQKLGLNNNNIETLPPKSYWACSHLRRLDLSNNKLRGVRSSPESPGSAKSGKRFFIPRSPSTEEQMFIEDEFAHDVFGGTLELLDLSNNKLCAIPRSVCLLTSLEELNLSGNTDLKTLPPELGNLTECFQLGVDGLNLSSIPKYVRPGGNVTSRNILAYLRAKQRKAMPYYRMKLMVIGLQGRGKTTLLAALRNKPLPPNISTVGIVVNEWTIPGSNSLLEKMAMLGRKEPAKSNPNITFSTWDLAGQQIYYSTHQCFLSSNTLYLAVWNTSHGEKGVDNLKPWLLNVQARAPGSHVIIVGTHVDLLPEKTKAKRTDELRLKIYKKYSKKGYPIIKGNYVVSCTTGENIVQLRQTIYAAAHELKESENVGKGESLIGRMIPLSYIKLQANVIKEAETRKKENKPPILNEEQMLELARQDPNNDILGRDELVLAARFLHENGVILHYNDRSRGLDKLYFIEPGWLCEIMALLVTVKETNAYVKGGILERKHVEMLLKNPRLPAKFMEQYIQLMERFEVALTLDERRLLVPSMLPRDRPGLHLSDLRKTAMIDEEGSAKPVNMSEYLQRLYKMNYVPSGFWSRLIARLMIAVQKWGVVEGLGDEFICNEGGKAVRCTSNLRPVLRSYSVIYWREGMGVVYEGGHLLVESYQKKERNIFSGELEDVDGAIVTVWSGEKDFSVLGFITDQVNSLISEWYPGLDEFDKHGVPLVLNTIPCPICAERYNSFASTYRGSSISSKLSRAPSIDSFERIEENKPHEFCLTECAARAVRHRDILCPRHFDQPVELRSLIPDLMLSDLPDELLIDSKSLIFNPVEENRLGAGGAGEVFVGCYKKQRVAIKRFYSTKVSWADEDSGIGSEFGYSGSRGKKFPHTEGPSFAGRRETTASFTTLEEELRRTKILSSFWELRQEVAVLARLYHPCVVALIGVCIQPLSIVLELSPLGSLQSILEAELKKHEMAKFQKDSQTSIDVRKIIFDRYLTYKIVHQVAHALSYLHNLGIIYRDLKSDNLLVWTLEEDAVVHVKLSDYGISRFATPQGILGEEGTPGFQAPEVRTGSIYNEKVDIFSFAMLIYEILSGYRPYHECRCSSQIKKALYRGERPSLQRNCIDTQMPEMEAMMEKCWRESIAARPSADSILERMEDPSFLCLYRVLPYADQKLWSRITAFIPLSMEDQVFRDGEMRPSKGNHSVLLWGGQDEERCYSVIDCQSGFYQVPETTCFGARVACLAKVGDCFWLGTESSAIEVFGRATLGNDLKIIWSVKLKAHVLGLQVEHFDNNSLDDPSVTCVRRVFASLANGSVVVISRPEDRQLSSSSCSFQFRADANEKLRQEAAVLSVITTLEIGDLQSPACCLLFVNEGKELWVGCGNSVAVVDVKTLEVSQTFRVYTSPRSNVRAMVTDGPTVFTINRHSAIVLQWHVETRQLLYKFNCYHENLLHSVIAQRISSKDESSHEGNSATTDPDVDVTFPSFKVSVSNESEDPSPPNQTTSPVDNDHDCPQIVPDVLDIPFQSHACSRQPSLMRAFKQRGSRNSSRKKHKVEKEPVPVGSISAPESTSREIRSRANVICNPRKRVTSALVVGGILWLGRESGDILVVDISSMDDEQEYGKVLAVLSLGKEPGHSKKEVHRMTKVGGDKVVCCSYLLCERNRTKSHTIPAAKTNKHRSFTTSLSPFNTLLPLRSESETEEGPCEKSQISIWGRWNTQDFKKFYKCHEDLDNASS